MVNWNTYRMQWPYLRKIYSPLIGNRPVVDILTGLDCADLHCAIKEVRGRQGELIARLTPLGWTCIGTPGSGHETRLRTNLASTYFVRDLSEIEELNLNLKRFWEIEELSPFNPTQIVKIQEQLALKRVERSITYVNYMY